MRLVLLLQFQTQEPVLLILSLVHGTSHGLQPD